MKTSALTLAAAIVSTGFFVQADASILEIQLGDMDLVYDGEDIVDAGGVSPDALSNATFFVDGIEVGVVTDDVFMDLLIADVTPIDLEATPAFATAESFMKLDFGASYLDLILEEVAVGFADAGIFQLFFGGAIGIVDDKDLPFGLESGDVFTITFSAQAVSFEDDGDYVTAFETSGTGELVEVPEPASLALLALGGLAVAGRRRK